MVAMRISVGILFVALSAVECMPVTAEDLQEPACVRADCQDGACSSMCPERYGYAETLFMQRDNGARSQPVIVDTRGRTFLSTSDLDFHFEPGLRVVLGARLNDTVAVEGSYFGLYDANASASISGPHPAAFLTFPGPLGPASNVFFGVDRVQADYSSEIQSAEINLVRCQCFGCCDCSGCGECSECGECNRCPTRRSSVEWLGGFRYLSLQEKFDVFGERIEFGGVERGVYDIRTQNNLFGGQVGARARRYMGRLNLEATGKVGIYGNDASETQSVMDFPRYYLRAPVSANHGNVAFVGELSFTAIYKLNDVWGLRAGYNLMWIEGVALAPDQLDFSYTTTSGGQIDTHGGLFAHGASVGLEARW